MDTQLVGINMDIQLVSKHDERLEKTFPFKLKFFGSSNILTIIMFSK